LTPSASSIAAPRLDATSRRGALLPVVCAGALLAYLLLPAVRDNPRLFWSFAATGATLLAWLVGLAAARGVRVCQLDVALRPQHYVQACAHTAILLYWGWHWRPVYDHAYLIVAQVIFAFGFDALLTWSRGERFAFGCGPLPIVFSTNLFLWFRDDWFYLQFLMLAVGFSAKALIRWTRDGRRTHVFNPSSFMLAVFSVALLVTGTSDITWGQDIAVTQFYPPQIYLFLFLVALPGQLLFGVTTMTMAAVVTTYGWGLLYFVWTGTYYFYDSYIPIAVFLGMHLLFTDPSTSPRTDGGRVIFGGLYGLSTVALYAVLGHAGLPAFYDKLLQVPLMNLLVRALDRVTRQDGPLSAIDPGRVMPMLVGRTRRLAYVMIWATAFGAMSVAGGVGDSHPGQWLPFWRRACAAGRPSACDHLTQMYAVYCRAGSDWSCAVLDDLQTGSGGPLGMRGSTQEPARNAAADASTGMPPIAELRVLLRGSKAPLADKSPEWLLARACKQGWRERCQGTVP
jgi:hypothetical protein